MNQEEVARPPSLYDEIRHALREAGDDGSRLPVELDAPPQTRKLLPMKLHHKPKTPETQPKKEICRGGMPNSILYGRLRRRLLKLPPADPKARWIWARPGYKITRKEGGRDDE